VRGRFRNYLLVGNEKIRESLRSYIRPDRDSHRVPIEYKAKKALYLRHFSVVNKLLRFVYLNICGVNMLSE